MMATAKSILILLLNTLLLASCSKKSNWSHDKIHSSYEKFSHNKLSYRSPDLLQGLDLEFVQLYRNNLKNREFGNGAPQKQDASEEQNFEEKQTLPKTDFSSCFGISSSPSSAIKGYLIIHRTPLNREKIEIVLRIEDKIIQGHATGLQGGQRFLLSEELTWLLIEAFSGGKKVDISIPGYHSLVDGKGFMQHFRSLKRSFMENPFHLPF
jgi:hypothetical protein